jgi:hypothetical protein
MDERDFFIEKDELKAATFQCPFCRQSESYDVRWRRRDKKNQMPPRANEEDRMRFAKMRSYMVRMDDVLQCKNPRCRRRFDIPSMQTVAFL